MLIEEEQNKQKRSRADLPDGIQEYQLEINRFTRKKEQAYEDYSDGIISKEDYLRYQEKYENQILDARLKIDLMNGEKEGQSFSQNAWIERLLRLEQLGSLDREIVTEMISMIYVYENNIVKIIYNFSDKA